MLRRERVNGWKSYLLEELDHMRDQMSTGWWLIIIMVIEKQGMVLH